jgi:hypothetical protein
MTKRFFIFSKLNYRWHIFPGTIVQWTHLFLLFASLSGRFVFSERPFCDLCTWLIVWQFLLIVEFLVLLVLFLHFLVMNFFLVIDLLATP